ncbi:MAG TPA: hypothetical protein PLC24_12400 [Myxococcota bacterium]|nr:hypothetical protein [Myxococcota bacterium]
MTDAIDPDDVNPPADVHEVEPGDEGPTDTGWDIGLDAKDTAEDADANVPTDINVPTDTNVPKDTNICVPNCVEHVCGMDPVCGSKDCGTCNEGFTCKEGKCEENICVPDCGNRKCGMDPVCGTQDCGTCDDGYSCKDGECEKNPCDTTENKCDGKDNDCDGLTDEVDDADPEGCKTYYKDADGDGYGSAESKCLCAAAESYVVEVGGDCCDNDVEAKPGQVNFFTTENKCNRWDYNCDENDNLQYPITGECGDFPYCKADAVMGWVDAVPACGTKGTYLTSCTRACEQNTEQRTQGCR